MAIINYSAREGEPSPYNPQRREVPQPVMVRDTITHAAWMALERAVNDCYEQSSVVAAASGMDSGTEARYPIVPGQVTPPQEMYTQMAYMQSELARDQVDLAA